MVDLVTVADRAGLKAVDISTPTTYSLKEDGRDGIFVITLGDFTNKILADPAEGVYIQLDGLAPNCGALVRQGTWAITGLSLTWFGAKLDGQSNDAAAWQSALNLLALTGGGQINFFGNSLVEAPLTFDNTMAPTGCVTIEGFNSERSQIWYRGAGNAFSFNLGSNKIQRANSLAIKNVLISSVAGRTSGGAAISVTRSVLLPLQVAPTTLFEGVHIIQEGGTYWQYGIYTKNCGDHYFNRCYIYLPSENATATVFIDNDMNNPVFGASFLQCSFNGAINSIRSRGWLESVYITDCSLVGSTDVLDFDATGTTYGNPHLSIKGSHLNGKRYTVLTNLWRAIFITGSDIYSGVGTNDVAGTNILIQNANNVVISGSKVEIGAPGNARDGIGLFNVFNFSVTGNILNNISGTGIGIWGTGSSRGIVSANTIQGWVDGSPNSSGIYSANVDPLGSFVFSDNNIRYFSIGVNNPNSNYTMVVGNTIRQCPVGIVNGGTGSVNGINLVA